MALTGELSDLSLSELIEFFCNQRKTGRLEVIYPHLPGYFYIQAGALVDARVGSLSGVEAVYYALTLPNASFNFSAGTESEARSIHQPWTQVVLEGLRRMDEGVEPEPPINKEELPDENDVEQAFESIVHNTDDGSSQGSHAAPLSLTVDSVGAGSRKNRMMFVAVAAVVLIAAVAAVPLARFSRSESTAAIPPVAVENVAENSAESSGSAPADSSNVSDPAQAGAANNQVLPDVAAPGADASAHAQRERERQKAAEQRADSWTAKTNAANATTPTTTASAPAPSSQPNTDAQKRQPPDAPRAAARTATVQVTYDEAGRVTQASGSDPTALRIARQKRFPAGKPGSTTVTIPIN